MNDTAAYSEVSAREAVHRVEALFVDVRELNEWNTGHIEGATHIALSDLMQGHKPDLPLDQEIVLYCQAGMRSQKAAEILHAQGFTNLSNMTGGFGAWVAL